MNVKKLKYNLEFGNLPEGKLFIEKYEELFLDINALGKFFIPINSLKDSFEDVKLQLLGLQEIKSRVAIEKLDINKYPYLKYCTNNQAKYYLFFKIFSTITDESIGFFSCTIQSFNDDFELY